MRIDKTVIAVVFYFQVYGRGIGLQLRRRTLQANEISMKLSAPEKTAHEASPKYRHTKDHRQWADFCKETWEVTRE